MAFFTDSTKTLFSDEDFYVAPDGTQYPANYPKSEIPGIVSVTETARPTDSNLVVTGCHVGDKNELVWDTRPKTETELANDSVMLLTQQKMDIDIALNTTDLVALRCVKANVEFPDDWNAYVQALRDARKSSVVVVLPDPPKDENGNVAYPAGT